VTTATRKEIDAWFAEAKAVQEAMSERARRWTTSGEADEEFIATLKREMDYPHWSSDQKKVFALCLKWFYETHGETK
jgi:hypothetical protein